MTLEEMEEQLSRLSPDTLRAQKERALSEIVKYVKEFVEDFLSTEIGVRIEAIKPPHSLLPHGRSAEFL